MKPARSPIVTSVLPSRWANASTSAITSGSVTTRAHDLDQLHHRRRVEEVQPDRPCPDAPSPPRSRSPTTTTCSSPRSSPGGQMPSSSAKIDRLRSSDSGTASTTRSASARAFRSVTNSMRASSATRSSSVSLPPATARAVDASMCSRPRRQRGRVDLDRDHGQRHCAPTPRRCPRPSCRARPRRPAELTCHERASYGKPDRSKSCCRSRERVERRSRVPSAA